MPSVGTIRTVQNGAGKAGQKCPVGKHNNQNVSVCCGFSGFIFIESIYIKNISLKKYVKLKKNWKKTLPV